MIDLRKQFYNDYSEKAMKLRNNLYNKIEEVERKNATGWVEKSPVRLKNGAYVLVAGAIESNGCWVVPVFDGEDVLGIIVPELAAFVERYDDFRLRNTYEAIVEYYERYEPMKKFRRLNLGEVR